MDQTERKSITINVGEGLDPPKNNRGLFMELPKRKSPRLPHFDYASDHYYFVTICSSEKKCIFGETNNLNVIGKITEKHIQNLSNHHTGVKVDKYVIMPNHIHMIIILGCEPNNTNTVKLDTVIGLLKSGITREIHQKHPNTKIWQRSFHDHIIRNQQAYEKIWLYIESNPQIWDKDCFYELIEENSY